MLKINTNFDFSVILVLTFRDMTYALETTVVTGVDLARLASDNVILFVVLLSLASLLVFAMALVLRVVLVSLPVI